MEMILSGMNIAMKDGNWGKVLSRELRCYVARVNNRRIEGEKKQKNFA